MFAPAKQSSKLASASDLCALSPHSLTACELVKELNSLIAIDLETPLPPTRLSLISSLMDSCGGRTAS